MYKIVSLKELAKISTGFPFDGKKYSNSGIRVVRGENVTVGSLRWDTIKCWNLEFDQTEKYTLNEGDIVIGMDGSKVGKNRAQIKSSDLPLLLAQRVGLVRGNENSNQTFLYYMIRSDKFVEYVERIQTGSSVPHISQSQIEEYPVPLVPFDLQLRIAKVLSALDSKISLNNRINAELEAMAKTIYDYWFVQFDFPFDFSQGKPHKNGRRSEPAELKPYKSSGGKMVWNEELKREIPEGWEVKRLGDYAGIKKGTLITEKTANTNGSIKVVSAGIDFSYFHSESNYPENTITISASGASAGFINFWREPIFACDCTTIRGRTTSDTLQILGFLQMRQDFIYSQARGSAQPHVYPKDIEGLLYVVPPSSLVERLGDILVPGNEKVAVNLKENQQLASLRDWLLPMLMNGQVTVKD